MPVSDCFVSIVAPLFNDSVIVADFVTDVIQVLRQNYSNYELVLVDDGSDDNTTAILNELLGRYECVRVIRLSRRFGEEIAIFAGLDTVIGDFVVVMIPNWDPPSLIPELVQTARAGSEVVFGVSSAPRADTISIRVGAAIFDWYCRKVLRLSVPKNTTQFRVLSRQAVNAVITVKNVHRYLRILSADVGFAKASFNYQPINRGGPPKRHGTWEAITLATDIIITASTHPLRFASWLGVLASIINLLYASYVVATFFFKERVAEGWTTLSLQNALMFFFVFLIMIVTSEYIGHILVETLNRPIYYVLEEKNSSVLVADEDRRNIVKESNEQEPANLS